MDLHLTWTGSVECDSFVGASTLGDTIAFLVNIHNELSQVNLTMGVQSQHFPLEPGGGDRHLGDYYFTVTDTGLVQIDTVDFPPWFNHPFWYFYGRFLPSANYISNPGDFDNDGLPSTSADIIWMIGYIFGSQPAEPVPFADANGDCVTNISDVVYLIHHTFLSGPGPSPGCVP